MPKPPSSRTCTCTGAHEYGQIPQCHAADVNLKILCTGPEIFHSDFQTLEVSIANGVGSESVVVCWLLKMSKLLALIQNSARTTCWRCESVKWPNESKPVRLICVTSSLALTVRTLTWLPGPPQWPKLHWILLKCCTLHLIGIYQPMVLSHFSDLWLSAHMWTIVRERELNIILNFVLNTICNN